jgi:hypothetical protein
MNNFHDRIEALFAPHPSADVIEVQAEAQRTVSSEA